MSVRTVNHGTDHDIECLCESGHRYVEGEWEGGTFTAGQCCDCINFSDRHGGMLHVCDLDAFIEVLRSIKAAKEQTAP